MIKQKQCPLIAYNLYCHKKKPVKRGKCYPKCMYKKNFCRCPVYSKIMAENEILEELEQNAPKRKESWIPPIFINTLSKLNIRGNHHDP